MVLGRRAEMTTRRGGLTGYGPATIPCCGLLRSQLRRRFGMTEGVHVSQAGQNAGSFRGLVPRGYLDAMCREVTYY